MVRLWPLDLVEWTVFLEVAQQWCSIGVKRKAMGYDKLLKVVPLGHWRVCAVSGVFAEINLLGSSESVVYESQYLIDPVWREMETI